MNLIATGSCVLFIVLISMTAGCTTSPGTAAPLQSPPSSATETPVPAVPQEQPVNASGCPPVPVLHVDAGQQVTDVPYGFGFGDDSRVWNLPAGSVIYYMPDGMTRVFDRNGTQILVANDSATMMPTPGGLQPSTQVVQVPSGAFVRSDGNMTTITLNGTCIATTISSDTPVALRNRICHCPMRPVPSGTTIPAAAQDDGLCHCP